MQNVVWALFTMDSRHFIKSTDKKGQPIVHKVEGQTLTTIIDYLFLHRHNPGLTMLRHQKTPHLTFTSQRIAKLTLEAMKKVGINTDHYKSHSLRGATATHLLKEGVPHALVQARGHWQTTATLDKYYARLHQIKDWTALIQGKIETTGTQQPLPCLQTKSPKTLSTKEEKSLGDEFASKAKIVELTALGVLRPLEDTTPCPTCACPMQNEAAYTCQTCNKLYHLRCMATSDCTQPPKDQQYPQHCFLCQLKMGKEVSHSRDLIEDPMGVCL